VSTTKKFGREIFWPLFDLFGLFFLAYLVVVTRIEIVEDFQRNQKAIEWGKKLTVLQKNVVPIRFFSKIVDNILGWARSCLKFEKSFCRDKITDVYSTIFLILLQDENFRENFLKRVSHFDITFKNSACFFF